MEALATASNSVTIKITVLTQFVGLSDPETDDNTMVELGLTATSTVKLFLYRICSRSNGMNNSCRCPGIA
jgi:hypothetical protein